MRQSHPALHPDPSHEDACLRLASDALRSDLRPLLSDWADYARGHLLRAGGIADQPLTWLEAMRVIDSEMNAIHREELEASREKTGRRQPKGADPSFSLPRGFTEAPIPYGRKGEKKKKEAP